MLSSKDVQDFSLLQGQSRLVQRRSSNGSKMGSESPGQNRSSQFSINGSPKVINPSSNRQTNKNTSSRQESGYEQTPRHQTAKEFAKTETVVITKGPSKSSIQRQPSNEQTQDLREEQASNNGTILVGELKSSTMLETQPLMVPPSLRDTERSLDVSKPANTKVSMDSKRELGDYNSAIDPDPSHKSAVQKQPVSMRSFIANVPNMPSLPNRKNRINRLS